MGTGDPSRIDGAGRRGRTGELPSFYPIGSAVWARAVNRHTYDTPTARRRRTPGPSTIRRMWSRSAWTRPRIALLAAALVLALLALGQLLLPGFAADRVRDELGDDRARVEITAFPAWKLVLGKADRLTVSTPTVAAKGPAPLGELLERARDVGRTDARIATLAIGELRLRDVRVRIADGRVQTDATLSVRALSAMVPGGGTLTPLPPASDGRPRFSARVGVLGLSTDVPVAVGAVDGSVEVRPEQGIASVFSVTVFEDPALRVDRVTGSVAGDTLRIAFSGTLT